MRRASLAARVGACLPKALRTEVDEPGQTVFRQGRTEIRISETDALGAAAGPIVQLVVDREP